MPLIQTLSQIPKGNVVLQVYNVLPAETLENKGIRDGLGIVSPRELLLENIKQILNNGWNAATVPQIVNGNLDPAKRYVALMCRDGYKAPFKLREELSETGLTPAFAIAAGLLDNKPSWTNRIEIALGQALAAMEKHGIEKITCEIPGTQESVSFANIEEAIQARHTLKDKKPQTIDGDQYVELICEQLTTALQNREIITPTLDSDSPFDRKMTAQDIATLAQEGYPIVSAGYAHNGPYTEKTNEEIETDIQMAAGFFKKYTGTSPSMLALPESQKTERVIRVLTEQGITAAFTLNTEGTGGITPDTSRMELSVIEITAKNLYPSRTPN